MTNTRYWLCLTTLRHRRFIEDAMHVIGLPIGAHLRLRYRRPYVDERLWAHVSYGKSVVGDRALIALGATRFNGESVAKPVRLAEVISASCEGSVLVLDVSLSEFACEKGGGGEFWQKTRSRVAGLPESFNYVAGARSSYVKRVDLDLSEVAVTEELEGWEASAEAFFEIDSICSAGQGYQRPGLVPFLFYITGLDSGIRRRLKESGRFSVEAGHSMSVEVHTIAAPGTDALKDPLGEVCFELSHPAANFESSRRVRIDSRRDVRSVKMTTSAVFRRVGGHLSIRSIAFRNVGPVGTDVSAGLVSAKNREELALARYDVPLRVGRWMPWIASLLVSIAAGVASYKAPQQPSDSGQEFVLPVIVCILAFIGLLFGLKSEKK